MSFAWHVSDTSSLVELFLSLAQICLNLSLYLLLQAYDTSELPFAALVGLVVGPAKRGRKLSVALDSLVGD